MKRILAALGILLALAMPAYAQTGSSQTPTQLNTEVNTNFPNNTTGLITPAVVRQMLLDMIASSPNLTTGGTLTGNLTINPTTGTTIQALTTNQTGPASTITTGPLFYNLITVTNPTSVTGPSTLTNGMLNAEARGFHVEMIDSGGSTVTAAASFHMVVNSGTPSGDKLAVLANSFSNRSVNGFVLGVDAVASSDVGTVAALVAIQAETKIYGGAVTKRMGIDIDNYGGIQAGTFDAAMSISNYGTAGGAYQIGLSYGSPTSIAPLSTTGDAIFAQQAMSIANFCNCANFTLTGGTPINFGTPFQVAALNNQNGITQISLNNNNVGNTTYIQFVAGNGTNNATVGIGGTGTSPALYTGRAYVTGNGTAALVVGTAGNQRVIHIVNNAEVGSWDSGTPGQLNLGVSGTLPGALQFLNATSGSITMRPPVGALGTAVLTLPIATDTLIAKATTDILTNKTYDTAGSGNVFRINGTAISAVTGTGSAVLASSPTIASLTVTGSLTATGLVTNANLVNQSITVAGVTCTLGSTCGLSTVTNSLTGDVALNAATYTTGPTVAQGTSGTWFAAGTVTITDTGAAPSVKCKLWDGTTVIDSASVGGYGSAGVFPTVSLLGYLASPAANIRIDCINVAGTTGKLLFNQSGNSKDSTLSVVRIN